MPLFENREALVKAMDEAEARLRNQYFEIQFEYLVRNTTTMVKNSADEHNDCPMKLAFKIIDKLEDDEANKDIALMVVRRLEAEGPPKT